MGQAPLLAVIGSPAGDTITRFVIHIFQTRYLQRNAATQAMVNVDIIRELFIHNKRKTLMDSSILKQNLVYELKYILLTRRQLFRNILLPNNGLTVKRVIYIFSNYLFISFTMSVSIYLFRELVKRIQE